MTTVQTLFLAGLATLLALGGCHAPRREGGPHYYSGWAGYEIPQRPTGELTLEEAKELTSFYEAYFDGRGRLIKFTKVLEGQIEWRDEYSYTETGSVFRTHTAADGSEKTQRYD